MSNLVPALSLASNGIAVFPCSGVDGDDGKRPLVPWRGDSTTDSDKIGRWFHRWPSCAIAVDVGKSGLFVIDCDKPKPDKGVTVDGEAWFENLIVENNAESFPFVTCRTPSGGLHYIFRQPEGEPLRNSRGGLPKKVECNVDLRGVGGYIMAPGSKMQDGREYALKGDLASVPPIPDWLLGILRKPEPAEQQPTAFVPTITLPPSPTRVAAYSHAGFAAEVEEVRSAPKGTRNETLNTSAFKIGTMVGAGWVSEGEAYAALTSAVAGWADQPKTLDTLRRGLREGMGKPRAALPDDVSIDHAAMVAPLLARHESGAVYDKATGEIVEPAPMQVGTITFPPGLVGEIAKWIIATARRPQPLLSLGAALCIVGTVVGRKVAGPTKSGTHLYVVGLAPTGSGKDRPLSACKRVLFAANTSGQEVGPSEFISMPAVINMAKRHPCTLCAMDEFGSFLKRINSRRASGFEQSITKMLRTFWGSSFETTMTPEWAGKPAERIESPALSIFGASTHGEFYEALESGDINNGVVNRLLVLSVDERPDDREPLCDPQVVPPALVDQVKRLWAIRGDVAGATSNASLVVPEPLHVGWGHGAAEVWQRLGRDLARREQEAPEEAPFLARTHEYAVRIATIVAVGRGASTVEVPDVEFGAALAMRSAVDVIAGARGYMAETDNQANANLILRALRSAGGGWVDNARLLRALNNRLRMRDFKDLTAQLVETGQVQYDQAGSRFRLGA